jgi:L-alanine-DL-glutamate epimerase-like enolase superfamily enzyme
MTQTPLVEKITATAYRVPTEGGPEADGTLCWEATEMVAVDVESQGHSGFGYSYTAGEAARDLIQNKLTGCLLGENVMSIPQHWRRMNDRLRNAGRPGLGMMAISAVDQALWDLKAKLLDIPLVELWGEARPFALAYGSGGFVNRDDAELEEQLDDWLNAGFTYVKIKIGTDVEEDTRRVALAREVIGEDIQLMVDANGAYDKRTALALIESIGPYDVCWLEEPVSSDDLDGLRWLRDRAPGGMTIAAGEYGWGLHYYRQMLAAGAVDILQADATRCGYTGFYQLASLCEAFSVPLSAHCAPAVHAPLCCSVPAFRHLEYFHDHVRIESMIFNHHSELREGTVTPAREIAGHGVSLNREAAEPYRV